jgi:hypothetical protein
MHNEKFNYIKFWCDLNVIIRIYHLINICGKRLSSNLTIQLQYLTV